MMMALDTIYNVNIHDRLLVRMGSNLCYWEVSQVEKLSPGPKPMCLIMFFALLHTLKECLGWPRESFSCPAAHYASAAICQLWGEPGQPAFHTAPRLAGTFSAATAGSGPTKADTETDVVSC